MPPAQALSTWTASGVPRQPGAWLTTVARRRAFDLLRREATLRRRLPLLLVDEVLAVGDQGFTHKCLDK